MNNNMNNINANTTVVSQNNNENIVNSDNNVDNFQPNYENKNLNLNNNNESLPNFLCGISLVCMYVPTLLLTILTSIEINFDYMSVLNIFASLTSLAAWIIMIYVRVKYPKNTFGKVLMWFYIFSTVISIVRMIIIMVLCGASFEAFISCCQDLEYVELLKFR